MESSKLIRDSPFGQEFNLPTVYRWDFVKFVKILTILTPLAQDPSFDPRPILGKACIHDVVDDTDVLRDAVSAVNNDISS
jgi:hypothetical protein